MKLFTDYERHHLATMIPGVDTPERLQAETAAELAHAADRPLRKGGGLIFLGMASFFTNAEEEKTPQAAGL